MDDFPGAIEGLPIREKQPHSGAGRRTGSCGWNRFGLIINILGMDGGRSHSSVNVAMLPTGHMKMAEGQKCGSVS